MKIVQNPKIMHSIAFELLKKDKSVGLILTMGALHPGHFSLIQASIRDNQHTIVSIFLNPTQFAPHEDLNSYPKNPQQDIQKLQNLQVDYLFLPSPQDIYSQNFQTTVSVDQLTQTLCGLSRPIYFKGVVTVCSILFHIIPATWSYFGQKDYQQALVIQKLVQDLHFPIKIKILPIVRDTDGLALSSRNAYLSPQDRKNALLIYQSLELAKTMIQNGEKNVQVIKDNIKKMLNNPPQISIDYFEISHSQTLQNLNCIQTGDHIFISLAVFVRKTRLIDNLLLSV